MQYLIESFQIIISWLTEILRIIVSWPVVVFFIFIIFKTTLKNFILTRSFKVKAGGTGFEVSPLEQQKMIKEGSEYLPDKEIKQPGAVDRKVYDQLFSAYIFERACNFIYGTQIGTLEYLENSPNQTASTIALKCFHETYCCLYYRFFGFKNRPCADLINYFAFLEVCQFIKIEHGVTVTQQHMRITSTGINFLEYIRKSYGEKYRVMRGF